MTAAKRSIDQALAVFAHELREPLASILFAVQALDASGDEERASRDLFAIVQRQSQYAARLIEDVLEGCRANSGKTRLHEDRFDLRSVVTRAVETTSPLLIQRGHRLALDLPGEPVFVTADSLRLQQVVVNLLSNAAKYTPPNGQVRLAVRAAVDFVVLEVRDDGIGIPPALLPRVFDLYRQGESSSSSAFAGLGIGLALVKSLVEMHGGSVSAHSEGMGTGSTFVVQLPVIGGSIPKTCDYRLPASGCAGMNHHVVSDAMADA
jgi:signal transduction histidine kinase